MRFDHITSSKVVKLVICEVVNLAVIEAREPVRRRAILVLGRSGHDIGENGAAKPIWRCSSETQQKRSAAARDRRAGVDRSGCQTRLLDVNAMQIRECSFTKEGGETAATAALPATPRMERVVVEWSGAAAEGAEAEALAGAVGGGEVGEDGAASSFAS